MLEESSYISQMKTRDPYCRLRIKKSYSSRDREEEIITMYNISIDLLTNYPKVHVPPSKVLLTIIVNKDNKKMS
jgi:hypothetical protein